MRKLILKLFLEWSLDNHMKDSEKSLIYQFWLLVNVRPSIYYRWKMNNHDWISSIIDENMMFIHETHVQL
jgi:hypothetical protein